MKHATENDTKLTLIATCAMGLESVLKEEVRKLGYPISAVSDGRVAYLAPLSGICHSNLWLRTAGRVYLQMARFRAVTFDELFEQVHALPWSEWIGAQDSFDVTKIMSRKSVLFSRSDAQAIVKKAIAESLKKAHKVKHLPETGARYDIRVWIESDEVLLSIDTTGEGLHKRGYRVAADKAPLRETLAAGLIYLSRWRADRDVFLDPLCGSGTLLLEAAMMAIHRAPGLDRGFHSEHWVRLPQSVWDAAREEARDRMNPKAEFRIFGSDISPKALMMARENMQSLGVSVPVQTLDVSELRSRFERGKVITNPPYAERIGEQREVENLYVQMGTVFRERFDAWSVYVLSANEEFESFYGKKASKKRKLYNGPIKCDYYQFWA